MNSKTPFIYLYDGTFEGLLTCVYHHYYTAPAADISLSGEYQPSLLYGAKAIETDEEKAARVYNAIQEKISDYDLRCIYRAFLSSISGKEMIILKYIVKGFKLGRRLSSYHADPDVHDLQSIVKKINVETERMLQFVRFSVMKAGANCPDQELLPGNTDLEIIPRESEMEATLLYAEIEPDHDVLELIAGHFTDRFRHDPFIIHDIRRNKALIAYEKKWYISAFTAEDVPAFAQEELEYRKLWRTYFEHIAIKERINPRCQRNFMPDRYWKHLTEVNEIPNI